MRSYPVQLLFSSPVDFQKVHDLLLLEREIWNACSKMVFNAKPDLNLNSVHCLCYRKLRDLFPLANSCLISGVQKDVLSAFRSIRSNKHKIIKAPAKKKLSTRLDHNLFVFKNDFSVKISVLEKQKRIAASLQLYPLIQELFATLKFGDPLLYERNGKIYLSFPFKNPKPEPITAPLAVGIDLGIKNFACTSEGLIYRDKEFLKQQRKLRYLKRCLASKGTKSAKRHLKKLRHKERNRTKNFCHNASRKIIVESKGNVLVLENLKRIKSQRNTKRHSKSFNNRNAQMPYAKFRTYLIQKAPLYSKRVDTVSPTFTSQIDSRTSLLSGSREKGRYVGIDGKILHSDLNASVNIALRSRLPVSCAPGAIYGQGVIVRPIVTMW